MDTTMKRSVRTRNDDEGWGTTRAVRPDRADYLALVGRLSHQSVVKNFEAYVDVPWDDPSCTVDASDPRFELPASDPLGGTAWYQQLKPATRARLGLHFDASLLRVGVFFENVLQRGLLELALRLPNRAPEFRYIYHEVTEESHHSMMFQEFVNRSGLDVVGLTGWHAWLPRPVVGLNRVFPQLFFLYVLGGEEPLDYIQRSLSKTRPNLHPLLKRITQIHVTEEARHISFAKAYLEQTLPEMSRPARLVLQTTTPVLLASIAKIMFIPNDDVVRKFAIPHAVLVEAYDRNPVHHQRVIDAYQKIREFLRELGILTSPFDAIWRRVGLMGR